MTSSRDRPDIVDIAGILRVWEALLGCVLPLKVMGAFMDDGPQ